MWFCEMRQMPRLRDCAYELTSQVLRRAGGLVATLRDRWADRGRVELIAPAASRLRRAVRIRPVT